ALRSAHRRPANAACVLAREREPLAAVVRRTIASAAHPRGLPFLASQADVSPLRPLYVWGLQQRATAPLRFRLRSAPAGGCIVGKRNRDSFYERGSAHCPTIFPPVRPTPLLHHRCCSANQ